MQVSLVLTVAQGKRLIARAVARMPEVRYALEHGTVAIGRGTTNGYVAEEILGHAIPKGEYVAGRTMPANVPGAWLGHGSYPDIVLKQGVPVPDTTVVDAANIMHAGDVFIKGGNALDYARKVVGILVGHPTGGTISVYGTVVSRKIHLIIPIGLEKLVFEDINTLSHDTRMPEPPHPRVPSVSLFPITGTIVTEIEAFQQLCPGVTARLLSAGGVAGAEGAVWLLLQGSEQALDAALTLYDQLSDEPNMIAVPPAEGS